MDVRLAIAELDVASVNVSAFCREHGLSRDRFYEIRRRFQAEGAAGLVPLSRAPSEVANRTSDDVEELIVGWRKRLDEEGLDAGAATIRWHLERELASPPSIATIWRVLVRRGFVVPDPSKRPGKVWRDFAAERANECWQIDDTRWCLADDTPVKIINVIDDCTRVAIASRAVRACTGAAVVDTVASGIAEWGPPARFLSDNAREFRHTLANAMAAIGVSAGHSRPYHPQTTGKVERFHQTMKLFLARRATATISDLQHQLDQFRHTYNHDRPHKSIGRRVPIDAWTSTPKAGPASRPITTPTTVTRLTVTANGRVETHAYRISIGAAHAGQTATVIRTGDNAAVVIDGTVVRTLVIDPDRHNQPLHDRPGNPSRRP